MILVLSSVLSLRCPTESLTHSKVLYLSLNVTVYVCLQIELLWSLLYCNWSIALGFFSFCSFHDWEVPTPAISNWVCFRIRKNMNKQEFCSKFCLYKNNYLLLRLWLFLVNKYTIFKVFEWYAVFKKHLRHKWAWTNNLTC